MKKYLLLILLLSAFLAQSQVGTITGKLTDNVFQDPIPFANIIVKDTDTGISTDFDGNYLLELAPGNYTLVYSYLGYETQEISNIVVEQSKTVTLDIILEELAQGLEEVIITTTAKRNTETSVLAMQKNSSSLLDGLSSQTIKRAGASNIAAAVKRIPGVSVQNGKYVFVRGLGDRYTKSILNGMDIPGLDPDRNALPMDVFPTSILENIAVIKSSTADLPADFTGGIVDIITKEFPSEEEFNLSFSTSYNPTMHFNNNYYNFKGGNTDVLGFDDGTRSIPTYDSNADNSQFESITRKFTPHMAATPTMSNMDFGLNFSYGNQKDINEDSSKKIGYFVSGYYKNTSTLNENAQNNQYIIKEPANKSIFGLRLADGQQGTTGSNNVVAETMGGISFKTIQSKYKLNVLYIKNGQSTAGEFIREDGDGDQGAKFKKFNLEYTERNIASGLLSGTHTNDDASLKVEWKFAPTLAQVYDKDVRNTQYRIEENENTGEVYYNLEENGRPTRIWRELDETNYVGKIDVTKKTTLFEKEAKIKFGTYYADKVRTFNIYRYFVQFNYAVDTKGDANLILASQNILSPNKANGNYILFNRNDVVELGRSYVSKQNNLAGYVSVELKPIENLKTIIGIRYEDFKTYYKGVDAAGRDVNGNLQEGNKLYRPELLEYQSIIDVNDFFPSLNLIYSLNENTNLRASYSRTTARPSFKEASIAQIYDPLSNITFIGNSQLRPTYINNLDMRYEVFGENNELIAFSGFYKTFKDPIELATFETDSDQFQPRNLGNATVYGIEAEYRKRTPWIDNLFFKANVSYIISQQKMGPVEYNLRKGVEKEGQTISDIRPLQGQSPYLINGGLEYNDFEKGLETGLFYNVQGKTLEVVGLGESPDVYTQPFHNLSFSFRKKLGKENKTSISLNISNILDDVRESLFESYNSTHQIFRYRNVGRSFSVGYNVSF